MVAVRKNTSAAMLQTMNYATIAASFIGAAWNRRLYISPYPEVSVEQLRTWVLTDMKSWYEFTFTEDEGAGKVMSYGEIAHAFKSEIYDSIYLVEPVRSREGTLLQLMTTEVKPQ